MNNSLAAVRNIRIEDFDYPLPEETIALHPLPRRDSCRLLVAAHDGRIRHTVFSDLPLLLKPDTLLIANETKVIRARMEFIKDTGARIEIFLLEPLHPHDYVTNFACTSECSWVCLVGNRKRWKEGKLSLTPEVSPGDGKGFTLTAELGKEVPGNGYEVKFSWDNPSLSFAEIVEAAGNIPIPPYLKRRSESSDTEDYQTVYSLTEGSVAAPTAGLHFTPELIGELRHRGNEFATVTLHVGAGTFQPVKSEEIGGHPMHTEWISVSRSTLRKLLSALADGRDILAVGTTSVRTLESLPYLGALLISGSEFPQQGVTQWMPYEEKFRHIDTIAALKALDRYLASGGLDAIETTTSIMIAPGFRWRIVNRLITNFHQPKSTLLLLVSSFLGGETDAPRWMEIYSEALDEGYRFLSYGDACLFSRGPQPVELPFSKSMLLRAITLGEPIPSYGLCEDVVNYLDALRLTRRSVNLPEGEREDIYIGEGAAPLRFLTAYAASLPGARISVTCAPGLQKRPISPLISALREIGADIEFYDTAPGWRIIINGKILKGGKISVDTSFTSQFISALLLASPLWEKPLELESAGEGAVSRPYLRLTEAMMANPKTKIEADWSAAAFFYEYVFMSKRERMEISSLTPPAMSLQGDSTVCEIYARLGVATRFEADGSAVIGFDEEAFGRINREEIFDFDFTDYPDLVPSLAVALCWHRIPFRLRGISHLRFKESNRLDVVQRLLMQLGYEVSAEADSLDSNGEFKPMVEFPVEIDAYGDHRIAMAFYPLELLGVVSIADKGVAAKSFPDFYRQF